MPALVDNRCVQIDDACIGAKYSAAFFGLAATRGADLAVKQGKSESRYA
jgi:hypothetical protein